MGGLLSWALVAFLGVFTLAPNAAYANPEKRVALVIGNWNYKDSSLSLTNPKNDAIVIGDVLKSLDFEVQLVTNVGKGDMDRVLERFARLASTADSALFYYVGHAIQYNGRNYLVPVDGQLEDEISIRYNLVSLDDVRSSLDRASGVKIMILDACRNNPIVDRLNTIANGASRGLPSTRGLARIDKTQGMVIAYATAPDDVALDGTSEHSPYTSALIKEMQEPGLEIATMFRRVARDVNDATKGKQRPETSISLLNEYYINQSDRRIWEGMRNTADIPQILEFLRQYPNSESAVDAKYRLDVLERAKRDREDEAARVQREALKKEFAEQQAAVQAEIQRLKEELKQTDMLAAEREQQRQRQEQEKIAALEEQRKKDQQAAAERAAQQQREEQERLAKLEVDKRNAANALAEKQEAEQRRLAAEKLAILEQARLKAEQDAAAHREALRQEEDDRKKVEENCKSEQAALDGIGRDETKLNLFISKSSCAETRLRAQSVVASLAAEREQAQRACDSQGKQLTTLMKAPGLEARKKLLELQSSLNCTDLNPKIVEALGKVDIEIKRELIRNSQAELRRLGCYRGPENGELNDSTKDALKNVNVASGKSDGTTDIDEAVLTGLKKLEGPICSPPKSQPEDKPVATTKTNKSKTTLRPNKSVRDDRAVRDERPTAAPSVSAESRPSPAAPSPRGSSGGIAPMQGISF